MQEKSASQQIDDIISSQIEWKKETLTRIRAAILQADSTITEDIKWRMKTRPEGLAVWTQSGIICFAEIWKDNIKLLFPKGAQLPDPKKVFNARLNSSSIRAIEFREGDPVDISSLTTLVHKAVIVNLAR